MTTRVGVISIIVENENSVQTLNALLHEYGEYIIGRMGIPYREGGVYIINFTLDAPRSEVEVLTHKLSLLNKISIKTTYAEKRAQ